MLFKKERKDSAISQRTTEESIWASFVMSEYAAGLPPDMLARVRAREPLHNRLPSLALYEGLALYHQRALTLEELEGSIELVEALERGS